MRPISIRMEGFTSFRKEVAVDFSQLDVFSITGDNGAGKSSILEAILFALYGRSYRLGEKNKSDLVSLGCEKATVIFEFSVEGRVYRITRSFKIKGAPFMKLEMQNDLGGWNTVAEQGQQVNEEIERLLRMPFEAFTKAVLIPQGHFEALLKPRQPKDRREVLIDLFELRIYEQMQQQAGVIARDAEAQERMILANLQAQYADASIEKLKEAKAREKEVEKEQKAREKELAAARKKQARLREVIETKKQFTEITESIHRIQEELAQSEEEIKTINARLNTSREAEKKKLPELEKERETISYRRGWFEDLIKREEEIDSKDSIIAALQKEISAAQEGIRNLREKEANLQHQLDLKKEEIKLNGFDENRFYLLQSLHPDASEIQSLKKTIEDLLAKTLEVEELIPEQKQKIQQSSDEVESKDARLKEAKEALDLARRKIQVVDLKRHLSVGDECPICGSSIQSLPKIPKSVIQAAEQEEAENKNKIALLESEIREARDEISGSKKQLELLKKLITDAGTEIEKYKSGLSKMLKKIATKAEYDQVEKAEALWKAEYDHQMKAQSVHRKLQSHIAEIQADLDTLEKKLHQHESEITYKAKVKDLHQNQRKILIDDAAKLKEQLGKYLMPLLSPAQILKNLKQEEQNISERIKGLQEQTKKSEVEVARAEQNLSNQKDQLNKEESKLQKIKPMMKSISTDEEQCTSEDASSLEMLISKLNSESQDAAQTLGKLSTGIEQLEKMLQEAGDLRSRLDEAKKQKDVYGLLAQHLKSSNLQEYVVSTLLEQLVFSANHFLKDLAQGRYLLDLQKDTFVVKDAWQSDKPRIVDTLSGGESFVVSLALALALSEFIKRGAHLESLFIDEGFGSLHRDKLDLVYEALGRLAESGKVIGLVTHVDELAARFPAQLRVKNTPAGSEVEVVRHETKFS